jgi:hypothetical protein
MTQKTERLRTEDFNIIYNSKLHMKKILIIEDDPGIQLSLKDEFESEDLR